MTGTDVLNLVPEEARKVATAYLKGLADALEVLKKDEETEQVEEKQ